MVAQLTSGPMLALAVLDINNPECSQGNFRNLAGPTDPVRLFDCQNCLSFIKFL